MTSQNFEFLRPRWNDLADVAGLAEKLVFIDPGSAAVKLRTFVDQFANFLYHHHSLPRGYQSNLNDRLRSSSFTNIVGNTLLTTLIGVKDFGNKGAHESTRAVSQHNALWCLEQCHHLASWLSLTYNSGAGDPPSYRGLVQTDSKGKLKKEKKALLQKLAEKEEEAKELIAQVEAQRARVKAAELSTQELKKQIQIGQKAVVKVAFDEAATRRYLIDESLISAGWNVGDKGANTEQVSQEYEVLHQNTPSGKGKADYVLWSEAGKPLAVIEAKKSCIDAEAGRTQAEGYADGLEEMHGFRPVIFYTNGHAIWIWNDSQKEPPRELYGYYSPESLQHLCEFQRAQKKSLSEIELSSEIAGRLYQLESIKRVLERFTNKHRESLIVQATGTGKTRVAISICKALLDASWAKRILFLCDRKELRKQARNAFKQHLPHEARVVVSSKTYKNRNKRIYFATYPAMMGCYQSFDVGFFDVVIADESHRSVYNRYRELLIYFDALRIGLTATPVKFIDRNTFALFGCEDGDPTAKYTYKEAINDTPPSLVPFSAQSFSTEFTRKGIKYSEMSETQRLQLEDSEDVPSEIEFESKEVDKKIFNKDTNRRILRNLMENGIKDESGQRPGKTIVFARSIKHARLMEKLFNEMYPQFGGDFCRTIVSEDVRAEELIDDFKGEGKNSNLTIAMSVDMLDTGLDVPEIVNLVFAKPVYSYVKFWQMIGRGTRLCLNLFGPGEHKTGFKIFDHWDNFAYFNEREGDDKNLPRPKSLTERLFEERVAFAEACRGQDNKSAFALAMERISEDLADLPKKSIAVKEKWQAVEAVSKKSVLDSFSATTRTHLKKDLAPLMQWRNIKGSEAAVKFDTLIAKTQTARVLGAAAYTDLKDKIRDELRALPRTVGQVKDKEDLLNTLEGEDFWASATVEDLEKVRLELRGLMKLARRTIAPKFVAKIIDVGEDENRIRIEDAEVKLEGLEFVAYRQRVEKVLKTLFENNETLKKIKKGQSVDDGDIESLSALVLAQDSQLDLSDLKRYFPETSAPIDQLIRGIIGLDAEVVDERFKVFAQKYPSLTAKQLKFLSMLKNHISLYGSIERDLLWEAPFTGLHSDGVDGVFGDDTQWDDLMDIVDSFGDPTEDVE
ncbi:MAG: DEAD/DEAH box helicase family protein [Planctomycetota bacterium]|nr:DEAD/DEAH box helicase family protein [Planctomycetota bacterium]